MGASRHFDIEVPPRSQSNFGGCPRESHGSRTQMTLSRHDTTSTISMENLQIVWFSAKVAVLGEGGGFIEQGAFHSTHCSTIGSNLWYLLKQHNIQMQCVSAGML